MKTRTLLIAAVMFLGLTSAAFAQAAFSVSGSPVTAVIRTGLTEKTGDITFTQISGVSAQGTITISYGVPITVPFSGLQITGTGGYTTNATGLPTPGVKVAGLEVNLTASNNAQGILVINVPAGVNPTGGTALPTPASSFTVSGVRVAIAGTTLSSLSASISTQNSTIVAGQNIVPVINSISDAIDTVSVGSTRRANINAATGAISPTVSRIDVKEKFLNAFDDINPITNFGVGLRFTLTAPPPPGVSITFPVSATTDSTAVVPAPVFVAVSGTAPTTTTTPAAITSTSTNLSVFYRLTTSQDPTTLETARFPVTVSFSGSSNLPIPSGSIQFTTTLFPIGTAFDADNKVITDQALIPRYVEQLIGPTTLANISSATTALLVPFAQSVVSAGFTYDTGFAIANTTEDPGSSALGSGITGAVAQSGGITFYFFPQLPTPTGTNPTNPPGYTTSATSPGTGLDASGRLPAGSTYTVLLSQLLQAAGLPAEFSGYVIIVTNFTDAHCLFVVSNFQTFSQGSLALVITGDRSAGTEALNQ